VRVSKKRHWIDDLIALGIGAAAIYFLAKILSSGQVIKEKISVCPYCGQPIKKWALECPNCRRRLPGRTSFAR